MDQINEVILDRARRGKPYSIVVVAEGIETPDKERPSVYVTRVIEEATGIESRDTVLGIFSVEAILLPSTVTWLPVWADMLRN